MALKQPMTDTAIKTKHILSFILPYQHLIALLSMAAIITGCVTAQKPLDAKAQAAKDLPQRVKQAKTRATIQSYADRFASDFVHETVQLEEQLPTAKIRLCLARLRVGTLASVYDIAAGPYPGIALLDMIVLVSLKRITWEEYWQPKVYGPPAAGVVDILRKYEKHLWDIAAKVLNYEQQRELRDVIAAWRVSHPDQIAVSFIRLSDFGDLGHKPALKTAAQPGGLFGAIAETDRAVDEVRLSAERAMFLFSRMQLVAGMQVDMLYKELLVQPEVVRLMQNAERISELSDNLHTLLESLPKDFSVTPNQLIDSISGQMTAQRKALIDHLMDRVGEERQNLIRDLNSEEKLARSLLNDMRSTLTAGNEMATSLKHTMASVNALANRFAGVLPADGGKVDMAEVRGLATDFNQTIHKLNTLLQSIDQVMPQADEDSLAQKSLALLYFFDVKAKEWLLHAMILGLIFVLAVLTTLLIYRLLWIRISGNSLPTDRPPSSQ
jgi:hypothetical protein